jgi:hypothetical protein
MRLTAAACACVLALGLAVNVSAQTPPRLVRFSGVVHSSVPATGSGAPQHRPALHSGGAAELTFGIYAESEGGVALWTESQKLVLEPGGRFTVVLGAATVEGVPLDLFTSASAKWLEVSGEGLVTEPRVLLVSVPYALKAADAETIGGKPLSAFVLAGETTGTGSDGLTYVNPKVLAAGPPLPQSGSGAARLSGGSATAATSGTANYLGKFTDATNLDNSAIYQTAAGRVGVNTTAPQAPFHVFGTEAPPVAFFDVYSGGTSTVLGALPAVYRAARGTAASPAAVQAEDILGGLAVRAYTGSGFTGGRGQVMFKAAENWTTSANGTYLSFATEPIGASTVASERMRITAAGHVGIGTTAPAQPLSVAGIIESTTGGIKFPDGTTQSTAARSSAGNNEAFGLSSLVNVTTGTYDTAFGDYSLSANTTGSNNTAIGYQALAVNTTGHDNTATGYQALAKNTTGSWNAAHGQGALYSNTTGNGNTGNGAGALYANTYGGSNTATGVQALTANSGGSNNTAVGNLALLANTLGNMNTASGVAALRANTTGSSNIGIGYNAGTNLTTGSNNIDIGHDGVAAESNTIRIGAAANQTRAFIAGIRGATTGATDAIAVFVDSNGQLGTVSSSRRVKDDIADMAASSSGLLKLRPVTFHYKSDLNPSGRALQYGLIAEEVADVYPELVAHSADGQIETVMYQFLPPMLLNEYQKQQKTIEALRAEVAAATAESQARAEQTRTLSERVSALEAMQRELLAALAKTVTVDRRQ